MPILPNSRHERFCQELAKGKSQAEAYELAGYKGDRTAASRLSTNANVQNRLAELQQRSAAKAEITVDSIREMLLEDRQLARGLGQAAAAVSAVEKLAKLYGHMIDRKEVRTGTLDELPAATLAELRQQLVSERDKRLAGGSGNETEAEQTFRSLPGHGTA
jgi:hypothetical protein